VERNQLYLAPVDPALRVELLEEARLHFASRAVGGSRAAVGLGLADPDFGIARAGIVFLLSESGGERKPESETKHQLRQESGSVHRLSRRHMRDYPPSRAR